MPPSSLADGMWFVSTRGSPATGIREVLHAVVADALGELERSLLLRGAPLAAREPRRLEVLARAEGLVERRAVGSTDEPFATPSMVKVPEASGSGNCWTPLSRMHSANFTALPRVRWCRCCRRCRSRRVRSSSRRRTGRPRPGRPGVGVCCSWSLLVGGHAASADRGWGRRTWVDSRGRRRRGAARSARARCRRSGTGRTPAPCSDSHVAASECPMSTASPDTCGRRRRAWRPSARPRPREPYFATASSSRCSWCAGDAPAAVDVERRAPSPPASVAARRSAPSRAGSRLATAGTSSSKTVVPSGTTPSASPSARRRSRRACRARVVRVAPRRPATLPVRRPWTGSRGHRERRRRRPRGPRRLPIVLVCSVTCLKSRQRGVASAYAVFDTPAICVGS